MSPQLKILIISDTYSETAGLTPLLREWGYNFTLLTDPKKINETFLHSHFNALFLSLNFLRNAKKDTLLNLKNRPYKAPVFFITTSPSDRECCNSTGIRAIDTLDQDIDLNQNLRHCLRIAEQMAATEVERSPSFTRPSITPLYAQLSNIRMLNKLMLEEVSRERLIKKTCHNMSQVAGYQHVWINLQQKHGGYITHSGGPDIDKKTGTSLTHMPHCINLAQLHIPQLIANYEGDCTGCPFHSDTHNHACLFHPLKHKGESVGELCALVELQLIEMPEFIAMFKEMANDLACATDLLTKQKPARRPQSGSLDYASFSSDYIRQLEQSEQRFQALFREIPRVAVQGYNKNREVIFWNKASKEFYGFTEEEALGRKIEDLIIPEFMSKFAVQSIKDWEEKGIPIPAAEGELRHKDGHPVPVYSSHAGFNNLAGEFEMYCLDINLSEIKDAHKNLDQLAKFPEENPNPVMRIDEQGEILYANPASEPLLAFWNIKPGDVIPEKHLQQARNAFDNMVQEDHLIACGEKIYNATFTPVNQHNRYLNIYALDVTDRTKAFEELRTAKQAAEAANLAKNDFLANMSHELRTPLNGIMGMAQLLEISQLTEEQHDEVDSIIASSNTLLGVISDILDVTSIEHDQIIVKQEEFNLKKALQSAIEIILPSATKKQLQVNYIYPSNGPEIFKGDKRHISQIVLNLLGNAVKFTDNGFIELNTKINDATVQLSVTDSGIGIAPDKLNLIFEKFLQIDNSRSRKYGGAGLGLHISKHLIEKIGGKINVDSVIGSGSTFTLTLPMTSCAAKPQTPQSELLHPQNEIKHVLVAEDNPVNQLVAKKMLKAIGCDVKIVKNGCEAVSAANERNYDLIFMDIQMPEMNGFEATRSIREINGPCAKTPIVALTAHAMRHEIDACFESGMNHYLSKPIQFDELKKMIHRLFSEENKTK